jgi:hypothetical protein
MEGRTNYRQRPVRCCFEPHRLGEELLALAYEQIWPQSRRVVSGRRLSTERAVSASSETIASVARRA